MKFTDKVDEIIAKSNPGLSFNYHWQYNTMIISDRDARFQIITILNDSGETGVVKYDEEETNIEFDRKYMGNASYSKIKKLAPDELVLVDEKKIKEDIDVSPDTPRPDLNKNETEYVISEPPITKDDLIK